MGTVYYYEAALARALKKNLVYSFHKDLEIGSLMNAPLRGGESPAVVLKRLNTPPAFAVRAFLSQMPPPALHPARLKWLKWLADYYQHNFNSVVHLSFPAFLNKNRRTPKKASSVLAAPAEEEKPPQLTGEQKKCVENIQKAGPGFKVHFIHGVTGSGKTEIYFRLIAPAIKQNKSALILVPEISLTPQHIERFNARFPGRAAGLHSGLSESEKAHTWTLLLKGEKNILIGARSALFCPVQNLAWIILDEEHETHFKQDEKLKYHARDSAVVLGKYLNIPVVLGSATPSLESWHNVQIKKYNYYSLKKRVFQTLPPRFEMVDMRTPSPAPARERPWWMSQALHTALTDTLKNKEQAVLFLNRRGEANFVFCRACGFRFVCPHCDIALTLHQAEYLVCHYCDERQERPELCPSCQQAELCSFGLGTEAVHKDTAALFPSARVERADRDEIKNYKEWVGKAARMAGKQVDILVGTQMIAKGLDFPGLTCAGIVLADQGLNRPDFRSAEHSFQLLTQMAGRVGRRTKPGRVILQTYNPGQEVLQALLSGDYENFAVKELRHRQKYFYPPFSKLVLVRAQGLDCRKVMEAAVRIKHQMRNIQNLRVLGPAPALVFRVRRQYRYHLLLKSQNLFSLEKACGQIQAPAFKPPHGVQVHINRDPVYM